MRLHYLIFIVLFTCHSISAMELDDLINGNFEDIEKTLYVIDHSFKDNCENYLQRITLDQFQQSDQYKRFATYAKNYLINLNYRSEICLKTFGIKEQQKELVIQFIQNNNQWYIDDAYLMVKGKKQSFIKWGFSPLSYAQNFEDLIKIQETKDIEKYLSLAKYGRLNKEFIDKHSLTMSKSCKLVYTNIFVYDNKNTIIDVIFITFALFPVGHKDNDIYKSGWLMVNCGAMKDYYPAGDNIFMDYLLNRLKDRPDFQIDAPNNIVFYIDIKPPIEKKEKEKSQ